MLRSKSVTNRLSYVRKNIQGEHRQGSTTMVSAPKLADLSNTLILVDLFNTFIYRERIFKKK